MVILCIKQNLYDVGTDGWFPLAMLGSELK